MWHKAIWMGYPMRLKLSRIGLFVEFFFRFCVCLYTNSNIPYELGKQATSFLIDKYSDTLHPRFNKRFIIQGRELTLDINSFQFNNVNYIQTLGTAMGIKMASIYAILTLAYLEENLYKIIGKKYGNNIKGKFTKSWKKIFKWLFHILEMSMRRH